MTTMAMTAPPLLRLFRRLDFALQPLDDDLALVLKQWHAARSDAPMPRSSAVALAKSRGAFQSGFVHRIAEGERDYFLTEGKEAAEALFGPISSDRRLSRAGNRRVAVRLRRLFEEAQRTGMPLLGQFALVDHGQVRAMVEALVAPLSEDGKAIDSLLCGVSMSAFRAPAPAWPPREPMDHGFSLFALGASRAFGEQVAQSLGVELAPHEERDFEDGEFKIRPLVNVRGQDVYVVFSLHGDKDATSADKLCRLLFFVGALNDAGVGRVTVVAPYLCYQRKDRQTKPRDPVTSRYVAQLFEAMGTDRVIAIEAHNLAAFQNAFRCDTEHLDARAIFARHFIPRIGAAEVAVVSPDLGGEKRAELFREMLEQMLGRPVGKAFMDKRRSEGKVTGDIFAGEVTGCIAIILDDLISGGGTMARAAKACRAHGALRVWCAATHGVFSPGAETVLQEAPIDQIVITDTVPLPLIMEPLRERLTILSVTGLVAQAIERCHTGGSITKLLEQGP